MRLSPLTRVLAALSVAATVVLGLRVALTGSMFLTWLASNTLLAWIPYVLACWIRRLARKRPHGSGVLILPTLLWLLYLPNAPYVITDLVHLENSAHVPFDGVLIAAFAAISLVLGLASLYRVHAVVRERLGGTVGWAFVGVVSFLCGTGIWMGRVMRWHSFDALRKPDEILSTMAAILRSPWSHADTLAFVAAFAAGLFAIYVLAHFALTPSRVERALGS